jgi:serine/threonine-protein kinase
MHAASLAHRDLKPENVLLDTLAFYDGALLRAKVVDFGSAVRTRDPDATVVSGEMHPGTELYRPPEAPQRAVADADAPAGDVWAFGLIVFELIQCATNQDGQQPAGVPVHDIDAVRFQLQRWKDETLGLQRKLSELAMECLQQAAAERPTFKVVEDSLRCAARVFGDARCTNRHERITCRGQRAAAGVGSMGRAAASAQCGWKRPSETETG